ncbi:MAG: hypothetical protein HZA22_12720, partial [Nitrospirae bacterium]|nr:hypothetical protein [Nitrospirota bacterium]
EYTYTKSAEAAISPLASGATSDGEYTFEFPAPIPAGATDIQYTLVYRGQLGAEADAVAAKAFEAKDVLVIDDWEDGQDWAADDSRATLSLDETDPADGSGALRVVVASDIRSCDLMNNLSLYSFGSATLGIGRSYYIVGNGTKPYHVDHFEYYWAGSFKETIPVSQPCLLSAIKIAGQILQSKVVCNGSSSYLDYDDSMLKVSVYDSAGALLGSSTASVKNSLITENYKSVWVFSFDNPVPISNSMTIKIQYLYDTQNPREINRCYTDCPDVSGIYFKTLFVNSSGALCTIGEYGRNYYVHEVCSGFVPSVFGSQVLSNVSISKRVIVLTNNDCIAKAQIPVDCTGKTTFMFSVRSQVVGNVLKFVYGTDATHTIEVPINIEGTDWERKEMPISDTVDKAHIGYFGFKFDDDAWDHATGATNANTIYIDQLTAE